MKTLTQQVLSYVSGSIVERRPSTVSGELEVWYQNGRYVLHSPDANYSYDSLHKIFQQAFKRLEIKKRNPKAALILGFGAGSIAAILCDELKLAPDITGVERDSEVIALGKKYFNLDRFKKMNLQIADAAEFVASCNARFDLVVSDVFVNKQVPAEAKDENYIQNLVRLTNRNGLGLINFITETKQQRNERDGIMKCLETVSTTCKAIPVGTINTIICWEK